ncbi:hypothetical protein EG68_09679 [Paragonimus skrjabini miyazakii]|uniref:Transposase n=1 Tax=Paragonimus skrjabini miyazakii TaxID=59628 RepID=A0A8S9YHC1_9TREM|nr:hypothetical protein EG68_09679 [Paragonimus skrjabini miyazakii]
MENVLQCSNVTDDTTEPSESRVLGSLLRDIVANKKSDSGTLDTPPYISESLTKDDVPVLPTKLVSLFSLCTYNDSSQSLQRNINEPPKTTDSGLSEGGFIKNRTFLQSAKTTDVSAVRDSEGVGVYPKDGSNEKCHLTTPTQENNPDVCYVTLIVDQPVGDDPSTSRGNQPKSFIESSGSVSSPSSPDEKQITACCMDTTASGEGGQLYFIVSTNRRIQTKSSNRSKSIQTYPPRKSRAIQVECTRKRVKSRPLKRPYTDCDSDQSTIPATEESSPLPPRKRISRPPKRSLSRPQRIRRTATDYQCLEDLYARVPSSDASNLLDLTAYDRVESICRRPFETMDQWLADGFFKCFELCGLITQPTRLVIWLAQRRLIANRLTCPKCTTGMILRSAKPRRHMYLWACRICNRKFSIRIGSIFLKAGVPEANIILAMYLWSVGYSMEFCGTELECSFTSARWYIWLALKSAAAQLRRDFKPVSGIVEVDWDSFLRTTSRRDGLALLCGVQRSTEKVFAVRCPKPNDKDAVRRLIQNNITHGSIIITRDRPMFSQLQLRTLGYPHYMLDKSHEIALDDVVIDLTLVDSFIESIKSHIRKQGGPGIFCTDIFLAEMVVRRSWGNNLLPMLFYSIAQAYNVPK